MRILHVLDHSIPLHSGYTFRTLAILREQRALGWETFHLTGPKQGATIEREETVDGWHFYRTSLAPSRALPGIKEIGLINAMSARLAEVVRLVKPDILHAHSPALNALAALRVGRRCKIPIVYEVRAFWEDAAVDHGTSSEGGLRYRLTRALETYAVRRADAVTTICEGLKRDLIARQVPAAKLTVIPNAVNLDDFGARKPDLDLQRSLNLTAATVLGFIGSFYAYEGLDLLLDALPLMLRENPTIKVLLVGGGNEESALKAQVARLKLGAQVLFAGRVPHAEVQRYYDLVDILVYPRHPMRLTELVTPLKPLEAMAQGRLVVASDVGGHRELITNQVNGVLFKAGDPVAAARCILDLIQARERWPELIAAGRRLVENERNWRTSVARYIPIYTGLTTTR